VIRSVSKAKGNNRQLSGSGLAANRQLSGNKWRQARRHIDVVSLALDRSCTVDAVSFSRGPGATAAASVRRATVNAP
jgi:hypothetical protein